MAERAVWETFVSRCSPGNWDILFTVLVDKSEIMTDQEKIQQIMQYALLIAAQGDDYHERELSPLHLIKYVYLADMEYARYNEGETFTLRRDLHLW